MGFCIKQIEYALPRTFENNSVLKQKNKNWNIDEIEEKTGILKRYISNNKEDVISLGIRAVSKLFKTIKKNKISFIIFVTQTHKNNLTSASCMIQDHFSLHQNIIAFDLSIGCSGFIYALKIAQSLLNENSRKHGLIICSDTYTKHISYHNKSSRPIFSDGSAAILLSYSNKNNFTKFDFGSDGSGSSDLYITDKYFPQRNELYMNGGNVALFAMRVVPKSIKSIPTRM